MASGRKVTLYGTAYDYVQPTNRHAIKVQASMNDTRALWRDPAIRLTDGDLDHNNHMRDIPLCIDHNPNKRCGRIFSSVLSDKDGPRSLNITAKVDENESDKYPFAREAIDGLMSGRFKGLSVRYDTDYDPSRSTVGSGPRTIEEVSLVPRGFHDNTNVKIVVAASGKQNLCTLNTFS